MEVFCCFGETCLFSNGCTVNYEDDATGGLGVGQGGGRIVAQFAVSRSVEEEETAGTFEGWVAGGAVVR